MDPTLLLAGGGLLALILGHEIFSDDDDDDDNTKPLDIEAEDGVARGTADDDLITTENITGDYTAIHAGAGNDTVETEPSDAPLDVYGDAGNDYLDIEYESEMTVDGGGGNDTIEADGMEMPPSLGGRVTMSSTIATKMTPSAAATRRISSTLAPAMMWSRRNCPHTLSTCRLR